MGTDRTQFEAVAAFRVHWRNWAIICLAEFKGKPMVPADLLFVVGQRPILERALSQLKLTEAQEADLHGYRELPTPRPPDRVYKAAPRDGVWATPPFMHNGSVPNLYEMLIPAAGAHEEILPWHASSIRSKWGSTPLRRRELL